MNALRWKTLTGLVLLVAAAWLFIDYVIVVSKERQLSSAVANSGGKIGTIAAWPIGSQYHISFSRPLSATELDELKIANQMRGHVAVRFNYGLSPADVRTVQAALPKCDLTWEAIHRLTTGDEFNAAISAGDSVLFVDCDWNFEVQLFRRLWSEFAVADGQVPYQKLMVHLDSGSRDNLWQAVQATWKKNLISPGGLKNHGGAGRVVWFRDGDAVDYAWCSEIADVAELRTRTSQAFQTGERAPRR